MHPHIKHLLQCIELEEKEQSERYRLDQGHTLNMLKAEGLALHPITITRKGFGYADYPEFSFRLNYPAEAGLFKDGIAIECFKQGEEPVKGIVLNLSGRSGEVRLFAPDFPEWIEDRSVGIKLTPDTRTTTIMKKTLSALEADKRLFDLFENLHSEKQVAASEKPPAGISFFNQHLNTIQQKAIAKILCNEEVTIVHGPPGTGKTTTLIEAIRQQVSQGKKIVVAAPSNAAVDHICKGLIKAGVNILRVGNADKTDKAVYQHTPEGKLNNAKVLKEMRALKLRADAFRKMALKYKRSFGKAEREQRSLLFKEVKNIRTEIKKLRQYNEQKLFEDAQVIAGTPIALYDAGLQNYSFDQLIIDEAGQCIEPLAWCIFPLAPCIVLAGDHFQLPPTVLSEAATRKGFNKSILEIAIESGQPVTLLDIQYRMQPVIAGFSSHYFYQDLLQSAPQLKDEGTPLIFIDTAGSGFEESRGPDGASFQNRGELQIIKQLLLQEGWPVADLAVISPYAGQVAAIKEALTDQLRVSTIDSFQGQEKTVIILSLVRSNDRCEIGFLKDYRRMNVAMTRAQKQLIVIGDSATIGADNFYKKFLNYVEASGTYRTVWEFDLNE
ncbi:AAA domain-containing protein [Niabella insulamsoli]|uniref:AAA domain-containing protein n=1 Tax=Niabella insulamsoli TaxID=3144874 RepID=UPI0031FCE36B